MNWMPPELWSFSEYLSDGYMESWSTFPPSLWACPPSDIDSRLPSNNNACESDHARLNASFTQIFTLLHLPFLEEQSLTYVHLDNRSKRKHLKKAKKKKQRKASLHSTKDTKMWTLLGISICEESATEYCLLHNKKSLHIAV